MGVCKAVEVMPFVASAFMLNVDKPAAFALQGMLDGHSCTTSIAVGWHVEGIEVVS